MKPHTVQVIDIDDILDELFGEDVDSMEQITEELSMGDWTYGSNAASLVEMGDFISFLADCVDNKICQTLTSYEQIDNVLGQYDKETMYYVDLEAS